MIKDALVIDIDRRNMTVTKAYVGSSGAVTLLPSERRVAVNLDASFTITLPPVIKCAGHFYTIHVTAFTAAQVLSIITNTDDREVGVCLLGTRGNRYLLSADEEHVVLYSNGVFWHSIISSN